MLVFHRRLPKFEYLAPKTIDEALRLLSQHKGKSRVIAGGTDLVPQMKRREIKAPEHVVDLKGIPDLNYIKYDEIDGLRFGALTTIRAIETSLIIQQKFTVLAQAAYSMASIPVRNRGTVAGNICTGLPSADTAPALLCLQAKLKLRSHNGQRMVNIEDFFVGPGETVLADDEILLEIQAPNLPSDSRGVYLKLTPRSTMDLALVGVAVVVIPEDGVCQDIRIALGVVAPTPIRARKAEDIIRGQRLNGELIERVAQIASEESQPRDSVRASAEYRREMVKVLTKRAIHQAIS